MTERQSGRLRRQYGIGTGEDPCTYEEAAEREGVSRHAVRESIVKARRVLAGVDFMRCYLALLAGVDKEEIDVSPESERRAQAHAMRRCGAAFGRRLRDLRRRAGLSMRGLAAELDPPTCGMVICRYENSQSYPRQDMILRLARALGVAPSELAGVKEEDAA